MTIRARDPRQNDQQFGPHKVAQKGGCEVFVHNRFHTLELTALSYDRDSSAAGGDDQDAQIEQAADRLRLDDLAGPGRGDDTTKSPAGVFANDEPATAQLLGLDLVKIGRASCRERV